jgi:hypothetical protein
VEKDGKGRFKVVLVRVMAAYCSFGGIRKILIDALDLERLLDLETPAVGEGSLGLIAFGLVRLTSARRPMETQAHPWRTRRA